MLFYCVALCCSVLELNWAESLCLTALAHYKTFKTIFRSPNSPASHLSHTIYQLSKPCCSFFNHIPVCFTLFPFTFNVLMMFHFHYIPSRCSTMFHFVSLRFPLHYFTSFLINTAVIAKLCSQVFQNSHWAQYRGSKANLQPWALKSKIDQKHTLY